MLLTTPLALTGGAAPVLWLVAARAGALLALIGAAVLAHRLAPRPGGPAAAAAVAAAALMALSSWWLFNAALGNSEGLLAAAVLWAAVAHLEGRRRLALLLVLAAALLRPEAWIFLLAYGAWLWRREPAARRIVVACLAALPLLWLGPDLIGAGGALGASHAALGPPSPGSASLDELPALAVLGDAVALLTLAGSVAAVLAAVLLGGPARILGAAALAWVLEVALMTAAGYAGNPRYLVAAAAVGCGLAGAGVAALAGARTSSVAWGLAAGLVVLAALPSIGELDDRLSELGVRADRRVDLDSLVASVGGAPAVRACGRVRTSKAMRTLIAYRLDVELEDIEWPPRAPSALFVSPPYAGGPDEPPLDAAQRRGFPLVGRAGEWDLRARCRSPVALRSQPVSSAR